MSWQKELDEKARREAMSEQMGGADKLARQAARGKLNARERLELLLDETSFREIGKLAGKGQYDEAGDLVHLSATNFIFGRGDINARPVVATADDFTVRGGASDASIYRKFTQAEQMAGELRLPLIRMIDGTGGGGSVKMLPHSGTRCGQSCRQPLLGHGQRPVSNLHGGACRCRGARRGPR